MFKKYITISSISLLIISCAHHRDVRPGIDNIHKVVIKCDDNEIGARDAIEQAQNFCEKYDKSAAFIKETSQYTGDISENNYKTIKKVSKVAKVIGGPAFVFGKSEGVQTAGGLLGIGGAVADATAGDGYSVEMNFKCI